jgi:beta-lactamase class A
MTPTPRSPGPLPAIVVLAVIAVIAAGGTVAFRLRAAATASRATANPVIIQPGASSPVPAASQTPRPRPSPVASRSWAPALRADPFGSAGAALADGHPGQVAAAAYDVTTGQEWSLGHSPPQAEASVVKLDILETLLAGSGSSGSSDAAGSSDGVLPEDELPVAQQMMEYSDNASATTLWYAAGGPESIGAYNTGAGLRDTTLSDCVDCPGFAWPGWGLSTTTPQDQIALLRQLVSPDPGTGTGDPALSPSQRAYALSMMENVTPSQAWGVSGGVPAGVTVALKNGWLPLDGDSDSDSDSDWQVNSVGWISGDGRDYLLAVFTTGSATEQDGIDLISDLAALVWQGLA